MSEWLAMVRLEIMPYLTGQTADLKVTKVLLASDSIRKCNPLVIDRMWTLLIISVRFKFYRGAGTCFSFLPTKSVTLYYLFFFLYFFFVVWKLCGDDKISSVHGSMVFELKKKSVRMCWYEFLLNICVLQNREEWKIHIIFVVFFPSFVVRINCVCMVNVWSERKCTWVEKRKQEHKDPFKRK